MAGNFFDQFDQAPAKSGGNFFDQFDEKPKAEGKRSYLGAAAESGARSLLAAGATVLDAINPFTTSEQDAAELYKNDPEGFKRFTEKSASAVLQRFAEAQVRKGQEAMQQVDPAQTGAISGKPLGELKYATTDMDEAAYMSPTRVAGDVLQSLPSTLALAVAGYLTRGQAMKAAAQAEQAALARGASAVEAQAAGAAAAKEAAAATMAKTGAAGEGAVGYGQQGASARVEALDVKPEVYQASPEYQRLIAEGYAPEVARRKLAAQVGQEAGASAGAVDAATNLVGGRVLGGLIGEGGKLGARVAKGAATEGATEFVQSAGEQFGQNVAMTAMNPNQALGQDVLESAVAGGVVGGVTGGAVGGVFGARPEKAAAAPAAPLGPDPLDATNNTFQQAVDTYLRGPTDAQTAAAVLSTGSVDEAIAAAEQATGTLESVGADKGISIPALAARQSQAADLARAELDGTFPRPAIDPQAQAAEDAAQETILNRELMLDDAQKKVAERAAAAQPSVSPDLVTQRLQAAQLQGDQQAMLRAAQIRDRGQVVASQLGEELAAGDKTRFRRAYENVAKRNGVASPGEAALLDRMSPNERLYDRVENRPPALKAAEQGVVLPTAEQQGKAAARADLIGQRSGLLPAAPEGTAAPLVAAPAPAPARPSASERLAAADVALLEQAARGPFALDAIGKRRLQELRGGVVASGKRAPSERLQQLSQAKSTPEKQVTFTEVDPSTLGERRSSAEGELSRQVYGTIKQVARVFGKKVVVFDSTDERAADGFIYDDDPNTIYINRRAEKPHLVVFGHELMHGLKRNSPEAYAAVARAVKLKQGVDLNKMAGVEGDVEELVSDLQGNRFAETDFWADVFREVAGDSPAGKQAVMKLASAAMKAVNRLMKALGRPQGFEADQAVENLGEVKAAIQKALATYAKQRYTAAQELDRSQYANSERAQAPVAQGVSANQKVAADLALTRSNAGNSETPTRDSDTGEVSEDRMPKTRRRPERAGPPTRKAAAAAAARESMGLRFSEKRDPDTETPEFKAWFGDSVLVDEDGNPLVLYHGTQSNNIRVFKRSADGALGPGVYLTERAEAAGSYAGDGGTVEMLYARMEKPLVVYTGTDEPALQIARDEAFWKENFYTRGAARSWARQQLEDWAGIQDPEFLTMLKDAGYDGVLLKDPKSGGIVEAMVPSPYQVKNILNDGEWSRSNPDIYASEKRENANDEQTRTPGDRGGRTSARSLAPLAGSPSVKGFNGPDPRLVEVAERYARERGIDLRRQAEYVKVDEARARRIAAAYDAMSHAPDDPRVRAAYDALAEQTMAQYQALADAGYKFWFIDTRIPSNAEYAGSPWNAMRDIRANKEMGVFPTTDGFGTGEADVSGNPLLADTGLQWPVGGPDGELQPVLFNDLFRAVHDAFGHGLEGAGFRAEGEENAWQAHVRLFTGKAVAAITTETRGQNSWLNYGPYGEKNRNAAVEDTVFADQKTGLMPEWTWTEGRAGDMPVESAKRDDLFPEEFATKRTTVPTNMVIDTRGTRMRGGNVNSAGRMVAASKQALQNFWNWFEGSAATDDTGRPLELYHSTNGDFDRFETNRETTNNYGFLGDMTVRRAGVFLTPDKKFSQEYLRRGAGQNVMPVYAAIKDPLDLRRGLTLFDEDRLEKAGVSTRYVRNISNYWELFDNADDGTNEFVDGLKAAGYDGAIFAEDSPGGASDGGTTYVAFAPSQVKSALGNRGTFDSSDSIVTSSKRDQLNPEIVQALGKHIRNLTPAERAKLRRDTARKLVETIESLPSANEMAAVAYAGRAKRGWYYNSARAIEHVFGGDAPRFAALLVAMSPQRSVETNLYDTLSTWKNWVRAGRPTDRESIIEIMGESVQGGRGRASVLDAWINNSVRSLSSADPSEVTLSGPKVNSFMLNLRGVVDEVTNDAWMSNYALVDQRIFAGKLTKGGDPGKGTGYLAMSAQVRAAAKTLTRMTGEEWTPAEVQETIWSWAKTLYESASVNRSAQDIVLSREVSDELIQSTPDFRTLFHDDINEELLRAAGLGDRVDTLRRRSDLGGTGAEGRDAEGEAAPFAGDAQLRYELRAAKRLDKLRERGTVARDDLPVESAKRVTETPEFRRWFGDSKVVDADGKPLRVYHGTGEDFSVFKNGVERGGDPLYAQTGLYFAEDSGISDIYGDREGGNVMPVYLSIKDPLDLTDESTIQGWKGAIAKVIAPRLASKVMREEALRSGLSQSLIMQSERDKLMAAGYDGIKGAGGVWIAFKPEQIKSAIGNNGNFDPRNPDIRESAKRVFADSGRQYTPEQLQALGNIGRVVTERSLLERVEALKVDWKKKLAQGLVDQFAPIKDLGAPGKAAYALARLSKGSTGAVEALLHHGKLKVTADGVYDADRSGGVIERLFAPLAGETADFLTWVAANRAERLMAEDREKLFKPSDIAALKRLDQGSTKFDYVLQHGPRAGQATRDRTLIYRDALKTFDEFNKNTLDVAQQSGLIDKDSRQFWEHEFYVPFYRQADDGSFSGASIKDGLVRQKAFERLKGGTSQLKSDLLDNVLQNWAHLIDAGAKNRAALATIDAAQAMHLAYTVPAQTKGSVWVMRDGHAEHYAVEDPYTLRAISSINYAGLKGFGWDMLTAPKRWLTIGVTASPAFKVRNLVRDSIQAVGVSELDPNILKNLQQGWKASGKDTQTYVSALAGGGLIRFGTMLEGRQADRVRQLVKQARRDGHMLDSESTIRRLYDLYFEPAVAAYNELGNRSEEINRAALYDQLIKKGVPAAEANLAARDLMDFSMMGAWGAVRFLTQVVPFLNARIQGLYKLGRGAAEHKAKFGYLLGAIALASIALSAAYSDDDDWKKREDWDKNGFWWFKIGGVAYRIPKPFEIGAIATLAERGIEFAYDPDMTGKRYGRNVRDLIMDNLAMNPVPQAVKPLIDLYANTDSFTGRPIENLAMQRLRPEYRMTANTSMTARGISTAGNAVANTIGGKFLSPVQVDHLIQGYTAWLGSFAMFIPELILREATDQPNRPALDLYKFATQGIVQETTSGSSYYVSALYKQAEEIEKAYATWRQLQKEGKGAEAMEFFKDHRDEIGKYKLVNKVKSGEAALNELIRATERSTKLSSDEKKERIIGLRRMQDQQARTLTAAR